MLASPLAAQPADSPEAEYRQLRSALAESKADSHRVQLQLDLGFFFRQVDAPDSALHYMREAERLSRRIGYTRGELLALLDQSDVLLALDQAPAARELLHRGLSLARKAEHRRAEATYLFNLANWHYNTAGYDSAEVYFRLAQPIYRQERMTVPEARLMLRMAKVAEAKGQLNAALNHTQQALRLIQGQNEPCLVATCYIEQGSYYHTLNDFGRLGQLIEQAAQLIRQHGCPPSELLYAYSNASQAAQSRKETSQAWHYGYRALALAQANPSPKMLAAAYMLMADLHLETTLDSANYYAERSLRHAAADDDRFYAQRVLAQVRRKQGRLAEARKLFKDNLEWPRRANNLKLLQLAYLDLARTDNLAGDYRAAYDHIQQHYLLRDSLTRQTNARELGRLEAQFESDKEIAALEAAAQQQRLILIGIAGGLLLVTALAFLLYWGRRRAHRANLALRRLNEQLTQQALEIQQLNAELQATLTEVSEQRLALEQQNEQINDSIRYASRIQLATLPDTRHLGKHLPRHFILYRPRDIVSGDFYWMARLKDRTLLAVVDCTGHGVPGAFMSVLGSNLLHQIVDESGISQPDAILADLDRRINRTLHQQGASETYDGMDVCLLLLEDPGPDGTRRAEFAGAGRPLLVVAGDQAQELRSARYPCGGGQHGEKHFPVQHLELKPGQRIYLFTDGVVDQFGSTHGRKLGSARLTQWFTEHAQLPLDEQAAAFEHWFSEWQGSRSQLDDVLLIALEA